MMDKEKLENNSIENTDEISDADEKSVESPTPEENENIAENPSESDEYCPSIFDDPNKTNNDKPSSKKAKKLSKEVRNIIIVVAICLGLSLGVFAIFKFMPNDDVIPETSSASGEDVKYLFDYSHYAGSFEDTEELTLGGIKEIHVKNPTSEFVITPYAATEKQINSMTYEEEDVPVVNWTITDAKNLDISGVSFSNSYINFLLGDVLHPAYSRVHTEDAGKTIPNGKITYAQECGLEKPKTEISVTFKENSSYTILLGEKTPTDNEYFLSVNATPSDSDKKGKPKEDKSIYRIRSDVMAYFVKEPIYYVDRNLFEVPKDETTTNSDGDEILDKYFTEGQLTGFDSIDISGSNFSSPMSFVTCDPTYPSYTSMYQMKKPTVSNCSSTSIDTLLNPVASGIAAKETLVMKASPNDINKYGLNNPKCKVSYVIKHKSYVITLGNQVEVKDDSTDSSAASQKFYAVMVNGKPSIYAIDLSEIGFFNMQPENYYTKDVYSCSIEFIKTMSIKIGSEKEQTFVVSHPNVTSQASGNTDVSVKLGDKVIDETAFKNYYQSVISTNAVSFVKDGKDSSSPALTITFTYTNMSKTDVLRFSDYSDSQRRYYCSLNGNGSALVTSKTVEDLISGFKKLAK